VVRASTNVAIPADLKMYLPKFNWIVCTFGLRAQISKIKIFETSKGARVFSFFVEIMEKKDKDFRKKRKKASADGPAGIFDSLVAKKPPIATFFLSCLQNFSESLEVDHGGNSFNQSIAIDTNQSIGVYWLRVINEQTIVTKIFGQSCRKKGK
jgi:hypothetical protein